MKGFLSSNTKFYPISHRKLCDTNSWRANKKKEEQSARETNDEDSIRVTIIIIVPTCALSHTVYFFFSRPFLFHCKVLPQTHTILLGTGITLSFSLFYSPFFFLLLKQHNFHVGALDLVSLKVKWMEDHFNAA